MLLFVAKQLREDLRTRFGCLEYEGVEIIGPDSFRERIIEALKLLKSKDKMNYMRVVTLIKYIVFSDSNSGGVSVPLQTYFVRRKSAIDSNIDWLASLFVHEAVHVKLQRRFKYLPSHKNEKASTNIQVRCLQRLGRKIGDRDEYVNNIMATKWWAFPQRLQRLIKEIGSIIRE
jgi:hypothetical protein